MDNNIQASEQEVDEINLLDLAITLAKHKKLILGAPLVAAVVATIFSLFSPNIYTADTKILPRQSPSGAVSADIKNPTEVFVAMLKSRMLQNNMIRRFKLQAVYETKTTATTRQALAAATTVKVGNDNSIIAISVDDKNPQRAALLANGYVDELQLMTQLSKIDAETVTTAKIPEAKESSFIQVLDKAIVPEQKSKPSRSKNILLVAVATGFLAILWAFITEALQNAKKDAETQTRLNTLKNYLRWN